MVLAVSILFEVDVRHSAIIADHYNFTPDHEGQGITEIGAEHVFVEWDEKGIGLLDIGSYSKSTWKIGYVSELHNSNAWSST